MTHKFCIKCGAKNFFDNPPQFCCSCGNPFNKPASASTPSVKKPVKRKRYEDDEDEDDDDFEDDVNIDKKTLKKGWVVEKQEVHFDKFKDHYASCTDPNFSRKQAIRDEFAANESALARTRLECRRKDSSKSIE